MSGLSLATRGWLAGGGGAGDIVVVSDRPVVERAIELAPSITGAASDLSQAPVTAPVITSAADLKPVMTSVEGPAEGGPVTAPRVMSAEDLKPVITDVEED